MEKKGLGARLKRLFQIFVSPDLLEVANCSKNYNVWVPGFEKRLLLRPAKICTGHFKAASYLLSNSVFIFTSAHNVAFSFELNPTETTVAKEDSI